MHFIKFVSTLFCLFLHTISYTVTECFCQKKIRENLYKKPLSGSLSWICSKRAIKGLSENERLKIGKNILGNRSVNHEEIKKALIICRSRPNDNTAIVEFLEKENFSQNEAH